MLSEKLGPVATYGNSGDAFRLFDGKQSLDIEAYMRDAKNIQIPVRFKLRAVVCCSKYAKIST